MTATTMNDSTLSQVISDFEATALSLQEKKGTKPAQLLPTPIQMFHVGKLLYAQESESLQKAYQALLQQLPLSYLTDVLFHDLNLAFTNNSVETIDAVHSICGLYATTPLACRSGYSVDLCKSLCQAYSILKQQQQEKECTALLHTLSSVLLESGLFQANNNNTDEESRLQEIMQVVQALTDDPHNTCFGDMVEWQERTIPLRALPNIIKTIFEETPQRQYLLLMLTSSPKCTSRPTQQPPSQAPQEQSISTIVTVSSESEMQRRIQLVKDVLPKLGEGFIETALSCFQGDVDRTVAALLEAQTDPMSLPPVLTMMDPKLPKRHLETTPNSYSLADDEARRITKARLAEMERTQEQEAYALAVVVGGNNEYDDDYDDQYDGDDGGELGGGDGETYDVDLDTIRNYNRAAMAAVAEGSFWEENRNLNRAKHQQKKKDKQGTDGEKTYRGPDKGKGGRLIGPDGKYLPIKKGGKKGKAKQQKEAANIGGGDKACTNAASNDKAGANQQTKIQQKRKSKNKAKVANHHRKERAQKKASQGM